ncbi:copper homeostasis membrane protein CopD [Telmatospirillum siberiense]|uniref:Copper resistance protein CopD n=1 Tax=Telmatospirillum siberiense TaxID=382514 RepID=A0A2N3PRZ2_9PROT|nr:copper homeostasis membrane protein CopD [Telmatospirillum siberiense]PKU23155.1 copper resistance protein CopD [Telmatospirillum siberiense]
MMVALVACATVHTAAVMVLFGTLAVRPLLIGGTAAAGFGGAVGRRLVAVAAWSAFVTAVAWLSLQSAAMTDDLGAMTDRETILAVLGDTAFGRVWRWHLAIAGAAAVVSTRRGGPGRLLPVLALLQLAGLGLIGHAAMEEGASGLFQRAVQVVHLLAGGAWLGALPFLWLLARSRGEGASPAELEVALRRFSGFGAATVALLLLTGAVNLWIRTGGRWEALAAPYGLIVAGKLGLVALMMVLALVNRGLLTPALSRRPQWGRRWLRLSVAMETLVGLAALTAAFVLGGAVPP